MNHLFIHFPIISDLQLNKVLLEHFIKKSIVSILHIGGINRETL